ncbi:MAG TPA: ornithine aminomutase subunit alpha [Clostridia bacterium]|nr:ornithine aminomutase subunit alpha [Clostridia bacterium]
MERKDDFNDRRSHLENLTDEELKSRFWELSERIVRPMIDMAGKYTSPSIERSILLRMGFSSIETKAIVEQTIDRGLMGKGAGHVVYRLSLIKECSIREAGEMLLNGNGWDEVIVSFEERGNKSGS